MEKQNPSGGEFKSSFVRSSRRLFGMIFDTIFPKDALVTELEEMSPTEFERKAEIQGAINSATNALPNALPADTFCLFPYRNMYTRTTIWQIKYKENKKIARLMAHFVAE